VHDGVTSCVGNDLVNTSDISFLGTNYGISIPVNDALECLDIGPTTDNSVDGRPTTDNVTDFEDLILYAINFGAVSAPQAKTGGGHEAPLAAASDDLRLAIPSLPAVGESFVVSLMLEGTGTVQGFSAALTYDGSLVEPIGVEPGELLARQAIPGVALSARPGNVDVALLSRGAGLTGTGEIARMRFRVKAAGDPRIALGVVTGRDHDNRAVTFGHTPANPATLPVSTGLSYAMPTPFRDRTAIECALARDGEMTLGIYGVDGRRIRTLATGSQTAGLHRYVWDGRDDGGHEVPAGVYFARLHAGSLHQVRTVVRLR